MKLEFQLILDLENSGLLKDGAALHPKIRNKRNMKRSFDQPAESYARFLHEFYDEFQRKVETNPGFERTLDKYGRILEEISEMSSPEKEHYLVARLLGGSDMKRAA